MATKLTGPAEIIKMQDALSLSSDDVLHQLQKKQKRDLSALLNYCNSSDIFTHPDYSLELLVYDSFLLAAVVRK
jgi:hypothetical protein